VGLKCYFVIPGYTDCVLGHDCGNGCGLIGLTNGFVLPTPLPYASAERPSVPSKPGGHLFTLVLLQNVPQYLAHLEDICSPLC